MADHLKNKNSFEEAKNKLFKHHTMSNSRRSFISKAAIAAAITPLAPLTGFGKTYEEAIDKTPKYSPPSDLQITDIKCGYVRGSLFVKIYTNQDIWGCGEGVDAIPGTYLSLIHI